MGKGGNAHQRAIQDSKNKREGGQAPPVSEKDLGALPEKKSRFRTIAGPLFATVSTTVFTIFLERGYLSWIPDWFLAIAWLACAFYWAWAQGYLRTQYQSHRKLVIAAVLLLVAISSLGVKYRAPLWEKVHPPKEAAYVAPEGHRAVRVEGNVNPSYLHCYDLPDDKQIECLCSRPVDYTLSALATPPYNNFSTLVDIKAGKESMYRIQLFARTPIHPAGTLEALPYGASKAAIAIGSFEADPNTLLLQSTAPEQEFKIELHSSEGIRLKCINQIN